METLQQLVVDVTIMFVMVLIARQLAAVMKTAHFQDIQQLVAAIVTVLVVMLQL